MTIKKFEDPIEALKAISELRKRTVDVQVDDFKITLRTLGAKEETETFIDCMRLNGQAFLYQHKIETISRAVVKINEVSIANVDFDIKKEVIGNWNQSLVDELYAKYAELIGSVDAFFEKMKMTSQTNVINNEKEIEKKEDEDEDR